MLEVKMSGHGKEASINGRSNQHSVLPVETEWLQGGQTFKSDEPDGDFRDEMLVLEFDPQTIEELSSKKKLSVLSKRRKTRSLVEAVETVINLTGHTVIVDYTGKLTKAVFNPTPGVTDISVYVPGTRGWDGTINSRDLRIDEQIRLLVIAQLDVEKYTEPEDDWKLTVHQILIDVCKARRANIGVGSPILVDISTLDSGSLRGEDWVYKVADDAVTERYNAVRFLWFALEALLDEHGLRYERPHELEIRMNKWETISFERMIARMTWHPEGAKNERGCGAQLFAWTYIVFAVIIAICSAAFNFASRDNAFERLGDMVTVLTTLLVTCFGLVKLTSEDPNAIRNTLRGFKVLRHFRDVVREASCYDDNKFRLYLMFENEAELDWLDPEGSCYSAVTGGGTLRDPEGLRMSLVTQGNADIFLGHIVTPKGLRRVTVSGRGVLHLQKGENFDDLADLTFSAVDKLKGSE